MDKSMTGSVIRTQLIEMLLQWKSGVIDERDVHLAAETLLERMENVFSPPCDEIETEALVQLDALPQQWITADDVPAIIKFLQTPLGDEALGLAEWSAYWEKMDFRKRAKQVESNPFYSKSGPYT